MFQVLWLKSPHELGTFRSEPCVRAKYLTHDSCRSWCIYLSWASHQCDCAVWSWSHMAACGVVYVCVCFCHWTFEGPTEAALSTRHCKKRPSAPFSTSSSHLKPESLTTKITGQSIPACVCVRDTLPHSMSGISAIKSMPATSRCSPHSLHEHRGPTGGSTSAAALEMMMLNLSLALLT